MQVRGMFSRQNTGSLVWEGTFWAALFQCRQCVDRLQIYAARTTFPGHRIGQPAHSFCQGPGPVPDRCFSPSLQGHVLILAI